ncbi:MAG: DUF2461 domain-containing protein [candidate division KSB1 bacterium]|nr:DUF2461 domain-containing protein [candidate division KSB1 bacterium]
MRVKDNFAPYITPALVDFFRELKRNNDPIWFEQNKERYESVVREPLLRFIADFAPYLAKISPHFEADPRKVGGSLFRIYRDIRFSPDKSPYKTHAGIQFRHESARDAHAPGFYLQLEPENVFTAIGVWQPDAETLGKIRDAIVAHPDRWQQIFADKKLAATFTLEGDKLKTAPRGYDPQHPLIEVIKMKEFYLFAELSEEEACRSDFIERYAEICQIAKPFMEFLANAIGIAC